MSEINRLEQKLSIKKIDKETINIKIFDNNIQITYLAYQKLLNF
jgi:hypothetical protein